MKINYEEWIKNFTDEEIENIEVILYDNDNEIKSVEMGFIDNESVANGHFGEEYSIYAYVKKIKDKFILFQDNSCLDNIEVYDNKDEALSELSKLEDSLYLSIEKQIQIFKKEIGKLKDRIIIDVKKEYNNSGNFYSFNILLDDYLLEDGVFSLDSDTIKNDIAIFDSLTNDFKNKYGIEILTIKKIKDTIGFERYYELELEKEGVHTTKEIHISGALQGQPKNITSFIDDLDIDEILDELIENI